MAGIYIHIPFCRKACYYCDFHFSTSLKNKPALIKSIAAEAEVRKDYLDGEKVNTIYFGGGTPSLLNETELQLIFSSLNKYFNIDPGAEVTLEANPDDLTTEKLRMLRSSGINRLSIGLQSFISDELKWMNRTHTAMQNISCVKEAQDAGFENITVDLIYGSRFQTEVSWEKSLNQIEKLNVQHLSCYNLTVEEKTAFGVHVAKKKEKEVNDELSMVQFEILMSWSSGSGFDHYEISNFSKEGFISRHNSSYWKGEKYLGLGPSAHSFDNISRQWNVSNNNLYIKNIETGGNYFEREELDEKTKLNEYILTRLRTKWGIVKTELKKNFPSYSEDLLISLQQEIEKGNIIERETALILSKQGLKLADKIASDLMIV